MFKAQAQEAAERVVELLLDPEWLKDELWDCSPEELEDLEKAIAKAIQGVEDD